MRSKKLRSTVIDEVMQGRLINWGRYLRPNSNGLGFPTKVPWMMFPEKCELIDELDALHIEEIVSSFKVARIGLTEVHATVLKIEYLERTDDKMNTVAERAKDVSRIYKMPCSINSYYKLLYQARKAVSVFAEPL